MGKKRRKFTKELKIEAVRLVLISSKTASRVFDGGNGSNRCHLEFRSAQNKDQVAFFSSYRI